MASDAKAFSKQSVASLLVGAGFQRDFDMRGPLARSKELKAYYGNKRLLFGFNWTQKPLFTILTFKNRGMSKTDSVHMIKRRQLGFRTELDYIMGNLSAFPGSNKRRFGWHSYLTYMPSVTNEVGVMVHTFLGRDYLNIRFDDPVFIGELGFYVRFNQQ